MVKEVGQRAEQHIQIVVYRSNYDPDELFVENSSINGVIIKGVIITEGLLPYECSECGIDNWQGESITLELDHVNGIRNDNRFDNLRLLCPNCHNQIPNFRGKKNIGKIKATECDIIAAVKVSKSVNEVLNRLGLSENSRNRLRIYYIMEKNRLKF